MFAELYVSARISSGRQKKKIIIDIYLKISLTKITNKDRRN